jgi:hypothetical protein
VKIKANSDECKVQKIMQTITRNSIKKIKINNLEKDKYVKFLYY